MSCNYADGLSPYHDKGQLGLEEKFDSKSVVTAKVSLLAKWINNAKHVVVHTGAGISTAAGIPDFRGPKGVWTLQARGEKPDHSKDFNEANPTITHMAITKLVESGKVKYVVSQNIDGLHLRSNLPRKYLSELHGNMFTEQCGSCKRQFVRSSPVPTVGQKLINKGCPSTKSKGRPCRGRLHDTILDWEHNLPENDLGMADYHSCLADLSISLGTTMQIVPSGNLPLYTKRNGGKLVIINLQPTKHDRKADLLIHAYVDEVMIMLMKHLSLKIPKYTAKLDPTRTLASSLEKFVDWTISDHTLKKMKKIYEEKCGSKEARKRLEMIYDDVPGNAGKGLKRKAKEEEDSDLEVLDVIVKPKRGRESSRRGSKKNASPVFNTTITIKKVTPPPKKAKYEGEKITIKKNVTPTKTKYEIVTKPKKVPKCEIVYSTDNDAFTDLDMICESDDDEMTNNFTYNFKMYLQDDSKKDVKEVNAEAKADIKTEVKNEIKNEEEKKEPVDDQKVLEQNVGDKEEMEEIAKKEILSIEESNENLLKIEPELKIPDETEANKSVQESEEVATAALTSTQELIKPAEANNDQGKELNQTTETPNSKDTEQFAIEEKKEVEESASEKEKQESNVNKPSENIISKAWDSEEGSKMEISLEKPQEKETPDEVTINKEVLETPSTETDVMDCEISKLSQEQAAKNVNEQPECISQNVNVIKSESSQASNPSLKNSLETSADQVQSSQAQNTLGVSNCSENSDIDFYNSEYNTSNNSNLDFVENNYYGI